MRPARAVLLLLLPLLSLPSCGERRESPPARLPADPACRWEEAGRLALESGDAGRALHCFLAAIEVRERRGELRWVASDRNFAGLALRRLLRSEEARRQFELAARLARENDFPPGEAAASNNLALLAEDGGDFAGARRLYRRALDLAAPAGREAAGAALYRENLARLMMVEGDLAEAARLLEPAEGEPAAASALAELAWLQLLRQEPGPALATLERALARRPGRFTEGVLEDRRGTALEQLGRPREARQAYGEALRLGAGRGSATAATLASLCRLEALHPAAEPGDDPCRAAARAAGAPGVPAATLAGSHYWQAQNWRRQGRLRLAQAAARRAADLIGRMRQDVSTPARAARFLEDRAAYWSLAIELSMELESREPSRGHDRMALADSERWRARNLIDEIGDRGSGAGQRRGRLQTAGFDLEALQAALETETCAFVLVLGREQSFLWRIGPAAVDSYRLPPGGEIEELAGRYLDLVATADGATRRGTALAAGSALAERLFGSRLARLAGCRRLVFVGDGSLAPYPLAALPTPRSTPDEPYFLMEEKEIVQLPSLGVLLALRRPRPAEAGPDGGMALIGDPWYDLREWRGRLRLDPVPEAEARLANGAPAPFPLGRLPFAALEMERIAGHWRGGAERLLRAAGPAATRELALSAAIARASIVHFSAHGELAAAPAGRSAIVLSALDREGRQAPQGGRLAPEDLAGRRWGAELVVASSCESASGKPFRLEGIGGLARGFLEAGANRALASLWKVEGEATAALMDRFYGGLIGHGLPPGEALRAAQHGLLAEAREQGTAWQAPYYWSGFVLIGDWRAFRVRGRGLRRPRRRGAEHSAPRGVCRGRADNERQPLSPAGEKGEGHARARTSLLRPAGAAPRRRQQSRQQDPRRPRLSPQLPHRARPMR